LGIETNGQVLINALTHYWHPDNLAIQRGGWLGLFGAEEGVAEEEEYAEDPDQRADFAVAAGAEFDESEGEESEAEARFVARH
jgi:hypothetical protein